MPLPKGTTTPVFDICSREEPPIFTYKNLLKRLDELHLCYPFDTTLRSEHLAKVYREWKLYCLLECLPSTEGKHFTSHVEHLNLRLYFLAMTNKPDERKDAIKTIAKILNMDKTNCFALMCKYHLKIGKCQTLHQLMTLLGREGTAGNDDAILRLQATEAHLLSVLGSNYYMDAVKLYERVFERLAPEESQTESTDLYSKWKVMSEIMKQDVVYWVLQRAVLYNKMLAKPNQTTLRKEYNNDADSKINAYYQQIRADLSFVTENKEFQEFSGWANAELGLASEQWSDITGEPLGIQFVENCLKQAAKLAPENIRVLLIVGRYKRQRAWNFEGLDEAIKHLKKAIKLNDDYHKAHHQLGLAYRSKWLIAGRYEEAKTTPPNVCVKKSPCNSGCMPVHYKTPRKYDVRTTSNPVAKNRHDAFLKKAVTHIKKAKDIEDTSIRYHTDLARLYISQRFLSYEDDQEENAEACFVSAKEWIPYGSHEAEAAYFYEQWALLRERQELRCSAEEEREMYQSQAIDLFFLSLKYSLLAKQRSRIAFNKLYTYYEKEGKDDLFRCLLITLLPDCPKDIARTMTEKVECCGQKRDDRLKYIIPQLIEVKHETEDLILPKSMVEILMKYYDSNEIKEDLQNVLTFVLKNKSEGCRLFADVIRWMMRSTVKADFQCPIKGPCLTCAERTYS